VCVRRRGEMRSNTIPRMCLPTPGHCMPHLIPVGHTPRIREIQVFGARSSQRGGASRLTKNNTSTVTRLFIPHLSAEVRRCGGAEAGGGDTAGRRHSQSVFSFLARKEASGHVCSTYEPPMLSCPCFPSSGLCTRPSGFPVRSCLRTQSS